MMPPPASKGTAKPNIQLDPVIKYTSAASAAVSGACRVDASMAEK